MKRIFGFIAMMLFTLALCVAPAMAADSDIGLSSANDYTVSKAEHRAIVCVRTQDQGVTLQAQSADGLSWEPLMDVTGVTTAATQKADSLTTQGNDGKELMLVKSDSLSTDEIIAAAQARGDVLFAEPDYVCTLTNQNTQTVDTSQIVDTGSADYSRFQWGLKNTGLVNQGKIGVDIGNTTGLTGSRSTVIAVMDTGIDYTHPDLQDQMVNLDQYPALEAATGCGKYGYCAVEGETESDIFDYVVGHGTHCAGIIAAAANGSGINGVMKNVSMMGVRIFDKNGGGEYTSAVIKAYNFLVDAKKAGVNVRGVNCSFGVPYFVNARELAIQKAADADIISIYASGNSGLNMNENTFSSTQTTSNDGMITVDALNSQGNKASYSNYGSWSTNVFAPGSDILSTLSTVNARFNAFTAALDPSRILTYNSFEENGGTADTEADVNPLTYCYWSDTADNHCGDAVSTGSSQAFLGSQSLQIDKLGTNKVTLVTAPAALSPTSGRKLYLHAACEGDGGQFIVMVSFRKADGSYTKESSKEYDLAAMSGRWYIEPYIEVPTDGSVDFSHFQMKLRLFYNSSLKQANIDSIGLGYGLERYGMMSGTSMAAPMVSGVFGLLASEYPTEPGQQIAARIEGGTIDAASLTDLCTSGGAVNVAKASTDPDPSIRRIAVDGQKAVLSGYFFGDAAGSVSVGGKAATVTSWSATSITVTIPSDLTGMQEFIVKDSAGASGRNYADVGNIAKTYTDLAIPSGGTYDKTVNAETAALGSDIYLLNTNDDEGYLVTSRELWRYDTAKGTWEDLGMTITVSGRSVDLKDVLAMTSCGGRLCLLATDALYQYDGSAWTKTALKSDVTLHADGTLADVKGALMYFGGKSSVNPPTSGEKDILSIDRSTGVVTTAGQMPEALFEPKVAVCGDTTMILGGGTSIGANGNSSYNKTVYKTTDMKTFTTCDALPGDNDGQLGTIAVAPTKTGLIMTGMVHQDGTTWQDTWNLDAATGKWTASDVVLSAAKTYNQAGCQVNGKFYVWGTSAITDNMTFFRSTDIESPAAVTSVTYEVHGRNYGWDQGWKTNGETAGTTGQALRLEALRARIVGEDGRAVDGLGISYQVHVQNKGWMDAADDGATAGTTGQSLRMEAVKISLTGTNASKYSVSYRVHVQNKGWTDWVSDGAEAGTTGQSLRAEAIEIKLTAK